MQISAHLPTLVICSHNHTQWANIFNWHHLSPTCSLTYDQ